APGSPTCVSHQQHTYTAQALRWEAFVLESRPDSMGPETEAPSLLRETLLGLTTSHSLRTIRCAFENTISPEADGLKQPQLRPPPMRPKGSCYRRVSLLRLRRRQ